MLDISLMQVLRCSFDSNLPKTGSSKNITQICPRAKIASSHCEWYCTSPLLYLKWLLCV
jgi:hypothetical protein